MLYHPALPSFRAPLGLRSWQGSGARPHSAHPLPAPHSILTQSRAGLSNPQHPRLEFRLHAEEPTELVAGKSQVMFPKRPKRNKTGLSSAGPPWSRALLSETGSGASCFGVALSDPGSDHFVLSLLTLCQTHCSPSWERELDGELHLQECCFPAL